MILYLSGNFPQLSNIDKEQAMADRIKAAGSEYHRLATFFYVDDCETIFTIRRRESARAKLHKKGAKHEGKP